MQSMAMHATRSRHSVELPSYHTIPYTARLTNGRAALPRRLDDKPIPLSPEPIITSEDCYKIYHPEVMRPATRQVRIKSRRGHGVQTELLSFDPQSGHAKGVLGGDLSHERSASRIQFHSPRKGHQRVIQRHLTALLRGSSASETWMAAQIELLSPRRSIRLRGHWKTIG